MLINVNVWIISFLVSLAFFVSAMIIFWSSTRDSWVNKKLITLIFGIGLMVIALTGLTQVIINAESIPIWTSFLYAFSFSVIIMSLSTKKWHYLFMPGILLSLFLPQTFPWNIVFLVIATPVIYLSYSNFCNTSCSKNCSENNSLKQEGREWGLIFSGIIISIIFLYAARAPEYSSQSQLLFIIGTILEGTAVLVLFYHIFKCLKFSLIEKIVVPVMIVCLGALALFGFLVNVQITNYTTGELEDTVREELGAVKTIAELKYPGNQLAKMVKSKDATLNDLSDTIYAKTNIGTTFFFGNERIASVPSASGKGRMIGSKMEAPEVTETVLERGEIFVGTVSKGGSLFIAGYAPIYEGDKIIGMISTGKLLNPIYDLQSTILMRIVAGVTVITFITFVTMFFVLPRKPKS